MLKDKLIQFLFIANIVLLVSGIIDLILYFIIDFHIPSYTVFFFTIAFTLMNIAFMRLIGNEA